MPFTWKDTDLTRCPFCQSRRIGMGEEPALKWVSTGNSVMEQKRVGKHYVECFHCGARGPVSYRQEDAFNLWNGNPTCATE